MPVPFEVFEQCLQNDPRSQEILYLTYAPKMFGICLRYAGSKTVAEELLQDGFVKIFSNLDRLHSFDSLDSWVQKIMINTALTYITRQLKPQNEVTLTYEPEDTLSPEVLSKLSYLEMLKIIQGLPPAYRAVFNLHVIDGYSHGEISEMLGITENFSRVQLCRAKAYIQKILNRIM